MDDLISRQNTADVMERWLYDGEDKRTVREVVYELPSAEQKKGEWIVTNKFDDCYYAKCNQCHESQVFYYNKPLTNFCPNCGADMRGEQND